MTGNELDPSKLGAIIKLSNDELDPSKSGVTVKPTARSASIPI